jgi:16S rRNA (guanine527-N7)-methyltransferase
VSGAPQAAAASSHVGGADVSRETVHAPAPPPQARTFFGGRLDLAVAFADLLAGAAVERGLIGPREVPRLWERHLLNCAVVSDLVPADAAVDDVGSGAGLPGIVLGLHRPDLRITLVEPLLRRAIFLEEAIAALRLESVTVVRQRAEERAMTTRGVDVVTARAVAPLERLVGWCLPLLKPGGVLLALKGSSAPEEVRTSATAVRALGGVGCEVVTVGQGVVDPPTTVVRVERGRAKAPQTSSSRTQGTQRTPRQRRSRR